MDNGETVVWPRGQAPDLKLNRTMHEVYIHNLCELSLPGLLLDRLFVFLAVIIDLATPGFIYLERV